MEQCPCGSNRLYQDCCGIYITGKALPDSPEKLMRSRYTAYSQANIDYIIKTMKGPAAKNFDRKEAETWAKTVIWRGLDVIQSWTKLPYGWVEFVAHFSDREEKQSIHELSEFLLENGRWFYTNAVDVNKVR